MTPSITIGARDATRHFIVLL